jgi:hypothetical protein
MAALAVTNAFVAGTNIVASQMNANFTDVVTWATQTPTLSTSGSATTVSGTLSVTEAATFDALATFKAHVKISHDLGTVGSIYWEGTTDNDFETYLQATDPTADRTITLPDATGTVALTSDITTSVTAVTGTAPIVSSGGYTPAISITTNDAQLILNNTIFN